MLTCERMHGVFRENEIEFFSGVPDSTFGPWMAYLSDHEDVLTHRIAVNEGAAVAHAAGYHLATRGVGLVYLQNSGLGNAVNPLTSLVDPEVYSFPVLLMVGWRGEPGRPDEPQHRKMGPLTLPLLDLLGIPHHVLDPDTVEDTIRDCCAYARRHNHAVAIVVRSGIFEPYGQSSDRNGSGKLTREHAVGLVADDLDSDSVILSTTGGISRELFEHREVRGQRHDGDFLVVGSMGHCAAIAMEVALQRADRTVCVLDGDGALLMHMGGVATIGHYAPPNFVHVVLDNEAHESTGGQPTVSGNLDMGGLASACGYVSARTCVSEHEIRAAMRAGGAGPRMIVIRVSRGCRSDLGRPGLTPLQTKQLFMKALDGT